LLEGQRPVNTPAENRPDDAQLLVVEDDQTENSQLSFRQYLKTIVPLFISVLTHFLLILCFVWIYISVAEKGPGASFFAGRGEVGKAIEFERIDGLNEELTLENAVLDQMPIDANLENVEASPVPEVAILRPEKIPNLKSQIPVAQPKTDLASLVQRQWSRAAVSSRSPGMKAALLKSEGGTAESEKAVARGLKWLAEHQQKDGSWSMSPSSVCGNQGCGFTNSECPEAATGLAILPFLGAGHVPGQKGPYQELLDKAMAWLAKRVDKRGRILPDNAPTHYHMYAHAIVTIVLCEATALSPDGPWKPAAQRAAQYIVNAQNRIDGGWRYAPGDAGDTSVFGWQIMALRSARVAGMNVPKPTTTLARRWLTIAQAASDQSAYAYQRGRPPTPVMTAEALLCRQLFGDSPRSRGMAKGTSLVLEDLGRSLSIRNYYYWYYATQLMHNSGGKNWSRWNPVIREKLIAEQFSSKESGHALGSWQPLEPSPDRWGRIGGPMMQTSLGLLTLEVYYRYLPLYQVDLPKEVETKAEKSE
jgi:hypothetical protein